MVTPAGAVPIDSGATFRSARRIDEAVKRITTQPVRWVVNTGGQDHRWLGNGYFQAQGAQIIAHAQTRDYLNALRTHMKRAVDKDIDISEAVRTFDGRPYMHLLNAVELMPGNASRTYLEVERE